MTFNSHLITKEIFKYFLNVVDSYHGKIILGKLRIFGKWYQSHIKVSNINISSNKRLHVCVCVCVSVCVHVSHKC